MLASIKNNHSTFESIYSINTKIYSLLSKVDSVNNEQQQNGMLSKVKSLIAQRNDLITSLIYEKEHIQHTIDNVAEDYRIYTKGTLYIELSAELLPIIKKYSLSTFENSEPLKLSNNFIEYDYKKSEIV